MMNVRLPQLLVLLIATAVSAADQAPTDLADDSTWTEQEWVERAINEQLVTSSHDRTEMTQRQMDLILGDIKRVTQLPADRERKLRIASKGAVDRALEPWRKAQESRVREQAMGATRDTVKERIQAAGEVHVGGTTPQESAQWTEPLARILSPMELEAWNRSQTDRTEYRASALSDLLVSEMERRLMLTAEQTLALEPLLRQAFIDYLPDMSNYIDRNSGMDFRLLALVFNGVPEGERTRILSAPQQTLLMEATADFGGWWQSIQQNHQRRTGGAKPPRK
jgi:hypothetical protein